jgi:hypothetical protein
MDICHSVGRVGVEGYAALHQPRATGMTEFWFIKRCLPCRAGMAPNLEIPFG